MVGISYILAFNVPPIELTGTAAILVICFVFRNMPVGVRAGIATLSQIDKSLDEASHTLGARSATTLRRVVLPLLRPAIVAALVYSFVRAMTAVSAVIFLVTAEYNMATAYIVGRVEAGEFGLAIAYSCVLIAIMLAVIGLIQLGVGERKLGRREAVAHAGRGLMVEFKSVSKRYGAVTAVDDISFRIEPGTLSTLLGPSGCGKTTTLRLIAGLEMVSSGTISIGGRDVTSAPASERDVSMVFQSYALFPHMNVLENVAYGPTRERRPRGEGQGARQAAHGRPRRLREPHALGALRRPAAARRGGARAGARAAGAAVRRAALQPRRQAAPARARGDPRAAADAWASPWPT